MKATMLSKACSVQRLQGLVRQPTSAPKRHVATSASQRTGSLSSIIRLPKHNIELPALPLQGVASPASTRSLACHAIPRPAVFFFGGGSQAPFTVLKLQVGIFGDINKWQFELDRLSALYDTDDEDSLYYIMQETVTMLLRNLEYCGYATSAGRGYFEPEDVEQKFNEVSLAERTKFKAETLVNVDGRRSESRTLYRSGRGDPLDHWMCVTLLVAAEATIKFPPITSVQDLRRTLTTLGSLPIDALLAFELMWTPQEEGDYYSKDELLMDYPTMHTL